MGALSRAQRVVVLLMSGALPVVQPFHLPALSPLQYTLTFPYENNVGCPPFIPSFPMQRSHPIPLSVRLSTGVPPSWVLGIAWGANLRCGRCIDQQVQFLDQDQSTHKLR